MKQYLKFQITTGKIILALLFSFLGISSSSAQINKHIDSNQTILGQWVTHDGRAVVEIFEEDGSFHGTIVKILDQEVDSSLIGFLILNDFSIRRKSYVDGSMHDPEGGGIYKSKLWLENIDTLSVRDYCGLFHKTFTWTRYKAKK